MNSKRASLLVICGIYLIILTACTRTSSADFPVLPQIVTTLQSQNETETAQLQQGSGGSSTSDSNNPATSTMSLWVSPEIQALLESQLSLPLDISVANQSVDATFRLEISAENIIHRQVYALVAPFPTVEDSVSMQEIQRIWAGTIGGSTQLTALVVDQTTLELFTIWWGAPAESTVKALPTDDLLDYVWKHPGVRAILPFADLEPRWKVLQVDGISPIAAAFDAANYGLSLPMSLLSEDSQLLAAFTTLYGPSSSSPLLPADNIDSSKLTSVVMTGVTALVRATAWEMDRKGITFPAEHVGELLRSADITHISNEVPFVADCPRPDPKQTALTFCSNPDYMQLLEVVGTDVVELTGDHFGDWGAAGMLYTLGLYDSNELPYYGGGENIMQARAALTLEHNGNRFAFIGCNAKGGGYATADENWPGAAECDFPWLEKEIARLQGQGYLVIVTFQHFEYYTYEPKPDQVEDFRRVADAGATIVSGSQAHQAQGIEFRGQALVMYGLGNLFFDQLGVSEDTAQALIARHIFYDGRHISTELITIIFETYSQPRFANAQERLILLLKVFEGSGW